MTAPSSPPFSGLRVTALAGGVGGARLAHGLATLLPPEQLTILVNVGDDFEHLGLTICPDLDTVMYTLSGLANPQTGWGLAGDTFTCMESLERLGNPSWFRLGDRDLATHLERTHLLKTGARLSEVTRSLARSLGMEHPLLPATDDPFRTIVLSDEGELDFQTYFVRLGCRSRVLGFRWEGIGTAQPSPDALEALGNADLIVFCPSNPFVSIEPILVLPGVRDLVSRATSIAVSPILGGKTVKGPAAKMFTELGFTPSAAAVAERYRGLLAGFVLDEQDAASVGEVEALGMKAVAIPTLMPGLEERKAVAAGVLNFGLSLLGESRKP